MKDYHEFLQRKAIVDHPTGIDGEIKLNKSLFPFQNACVRWALKRGRAALFEMTGLGKTPQQCEWAYQVSMFTQRSVLIVAPLAVAHQTIAEAKKILGLDIKFAKDQSEACEFGIYITNYQKLDHFDMAAFGGIALDESSILKSQDGATKQKLIESCQCIPFRLACTATPAPNDYMELGNHAEFLGVMKSTEMLSTFFVHDGGETQKWRLKGHAEADFWRWMASWAICITHPRDIGFDQPGYDLPPLRMHEVIVDTDNKPAEGELFAMPAKTLQERRKARGASIEERVAKAREIVESSPDDQWLSWCGLNTEAELCAKETKSENITGSDSDERKEKMLLGFASGEIQRITSKTSIAGFGMNWQGCHQMIFVGLSDSFEGLYQAIRRCYRFGQKNPVDVYIVISSQEGAVLENIKRKEADAIAMQKSLVVHMADFTKRELSNMTRDTLTYDAHHDMLIPKWLRSQSTCSPTPEMGNLVT